MNFTSNIMSNNIRHFYHILKGRPSAVANVTGNNRYPDLFGRVGFYQSGAGVLVMSQFFGLPTEDSLCGKRIFALHIHGGGECSGTQDDPFANAGTHYNPHSCEHPQHAGDLLPLFGNNGYAFQLFLTNRFKVSEIIGKTVIVHAGADDFTTQPSGNSGAKIACGVIEKYPNYRGRM